MTGKIKVNVKFSDKVKGKTFSGMNGGTCQSIKEVRVLSNSSDLPVPITNNNSARFSIEVDEVLTIQVIGNVGRGGEEPLNLNDFKLCARLNPLFHCYYVVSKKQYRWEIFRRRRKNLSERSMLKAGAFCSAVICFLKGKVEEEDPNVDIKDGGGG